MISEEHGGCYFMCDWSVFLKLRALLFSNVVWRVKLYEWVVPLVYVSAANIYDSLKALGWVSQRVRLELGWVTSPNLGLALSFE